MLPLVQGGRRNRYKYVENVNFEPVNMLMWFIANVDTLPPRPEYPESQPLNANAGLVARPVKTCG